MSPDKRPKTPNCFEREPERMRSDEKRNNNDTQLILAPNRAEYGGLLDILYI